MMNEKNKKYSNWEEQKEDLFELLKAYLMLAYKNKELESTTEEVQRDSAIKLYCSEIEKIRLKIKERREETPFPNKWELLVEIFGLNDFEVINLLASYGVECNQEFADMFAYLQGGEEHPIQNTIINMYETVHKVDMEPFRGCYSFNSSMCTFLVNIGEDEVIAGYGQKIKLRPYIKEWLSGNSNTSKLLQEIVVDVKESKDEPIFGNKEAYALLEKYTKELPNRQVNEQGESEQLWIVGDEGIGKRFFVKKLVKNLDKRLIVVHIEKLLQFNGQMLREAIYDLILHSILYDQIICLEKVGTSHGEAKKLEAILELLEHQIPFFIVCSEEKLSFENSKRFIVKLQNWSIKEAIELWTLKFKDIKISDSVSLQEMASRYILTPKQICQVVEIANIHSGIGQPVSQEDLVFAVRQVNKHTLGEYAQIVESSFVWEDLIVNERVKTGLELMCNQVKWKSIVGETWGFFDKLPYGRGISALFYGPPGTGKTMAAHALANELQLDLYRIDSSQLISKYIGETQKNIAELFRRAERINAILFFDEADALFGQRSNDVKDSHDKHANAETALLLQRFEDYNGIVILASNHANNMDSAFHRRIKFIINFEKPDAKTREEIWQRSIPKKAPTEDINFEYFAEKYELAGSEIKEISINAAFVAVSESADISNYHIEEMVYWHYRKKGEILASDNRRYIR